ncbi:CHAT domain-containing tetratricopeptide repeat protein [Dulcicalothrix desertica]|uniref:CHAT domain-containing tetratricopeptide repeat protein n=1 Tax=Dulcicalothrix desertica TaxID=32056 RepID=UPI000F8C68FE|nr:CHAT domain-containing protein [Dulcicalothrix desertica]TWH43401.1 CHAT domain-containing protein [Dulcicalothrix desertica PCC 7102]
MARCKRSREILGYFLPKIIRYGLIGLLSVVLFSESVGARATFAQLQIAQQTAPAPSVPLSADKQKRYQNAVKLVQEGQELQKKGTKEGYQEALGKYQQALKINQELGLRADQAEILMSIGLVNIFLSEYQQALDLYNQALIIWQELNQPLFEASVLSMIGDTYNNMGKPRESLEYLKRAESSFRIQKQFRHLAINLSSISRAYMRLGETKNALNSLNQALEIYRTTFKDKEKEADTLNSIAFLYSQIGKSEMSLKYYNQALDIYRERKDLLGEAEIFKNIGSLHGKLGKHDLALEYLNKALGIQSTKGTLVDRGLTINDIASIYSSRGNYEKAIEYYQKAKLLFHQAGWTTLESLSLGSIISIYRNFLGNNQSALKYTEEVLELNRKTGEKDEEASTFNQQGDIYIQQGDYQLALDRYNEALQIELSITKNPKAAARTLGNIALLYNSLGDSNLSIRTYNQVLDIYRKLDNKAQQARILLYMGGVYQKNAQFNEALTSYNEALKLLNKEDYLSEINIRYGLARIYRDKKDYPRAFEAANLALKLSKKHKYSFQEIASIGIIGSIYLVQGDYKNALDSYQKALDGYRQSDLKIKEAETLSTISMAYSFQKQYQQAINTLNEQLKLRRTLKDIQGESDALYYIAKNQRKLGKLETALTSIDEAIKIVENIRGNVKSSDLRTSYFATVQKYYKLYIDLLMELDEKNPDKNYDELALNVSERSRARGLIELLKESNAKIRKGANPELLEQERNLLQQINARETTRGNLENSPNKNDPITKNSIQRLITEAENLRSQYKELQTKIRTTSSAYAKLTNPDPDKDILKLPQIQQQLDKDTILLQYSIGEERSYLWAVTPNSLNTYKLPGREKIEIAAEKFKSAISNTTGVPPKIIEDTKEFSQTLLGQVAGKISGKRLVIVADGALQTIPFAALHDVNSPQANATKQTPYQPLIINHEIVNLPSITALATQRTELAKRNTAPKTLAVLADPVFKPDDEEFTGKPPTVTKNLDLSQEIDQSALKTSARNLQRDGWDRLPFTGEEAKALLGLVKNQSHKKQALRFDATYEWATNPELKQYRLLHFATHGFADPIEPERSGIVLSLLDKQGKPTTKGYLRLGDIFNLDFAADLVVLSACDTGLGKDIKGEGLVGLTRGLMYAGAPRVAVSLWNVNDSGTSILMQKFYKQMLEQGKTPAAALRAAQLEMLQSGDKQNPYYWASFTLQGEWK